MTPDLLIDLLGSLRRRVRTLSATYGVGVLLAAIGIAFVAIATLDYTFHLSGLWRLLLLGATVGVTTTLTLRHLVGPLHSNFPVTDVAGRLEKRFPQFQDRLRSAVAFIQHPTPDSPTMQQRTIDEALNLAATLPLREVVDPKPALRSIGFGAGLIAALVVGVILLSGSTRSILLSRVFNPFSPAQWPKAVQIALVEPIASRVPAGGRVDVQVRLTRGDSSRVRPVVFYETEKGVRQEFLSRADDGRYTASLDAHTEAATKGGAMKVWIVAGDDQTKPTIVEIVPRLGVEAVEARVTAPAYVGANANVAYNLLGQQAGGLVGSGVEMTVTFSKRLANAADVKLLPLTDAALPAIAWQSVDEKTVRGTFVLDHSLSFKVDAVDVDGFPSAASEVFEIVARPDQLPTAVIDHPRRSEERTADATIPLAALLEDDVGLDHAELLVTKLGGASPQSWTIPLMQNGSVAPNTAGLAVAAMPDAGGRSRARVDYAWALAALPDVKLKSGDVLEYGISVADNYHVNGQAHPPVLSNKLRITIISQEELTNRITDELRQVKTQLEQVKGQHDRTTGETDSFRSDTKDKPSLDEADASIGKRLQQQQGSVASASKGLADRLDDLRRTMDENKSTSTDLQQMSKDVSDRLQQTVEGSMKQAMQSLGEATQKQSTPTSREQSLNATNESQKQASTELADALKKLEDVGSLNATIDALQKMLDAQRKVSQETAAITAKNAGKSPEQMSPEDRAALQKLAQQQAQLAEQSAKQIDRLGKTADQLSKSDPASSAAMKAAQKQGQKNNVSPSQSDASKQISQNKSARQSQQQAEAGLEMMLGELREAQKRKLAELQKKLAELQAQIEILVRRQSGHNLDNLTLRGPDTLKQEEKVVTELTTASGRKPTDPKPELGRLLSSQGQTERNARDIAKKASDVPDGAEPASRLTRAASLMERAAVALKDKKLAEAYEPPQLDALAALQEAKRLIDEQKQKADDEIDKQQREAIRAAYVRIKADQEKLADETVRLEKARNPQGELNRADGVRLGQLPTEQQKLVDDIAKVGENLATLESVVYIWANKQISANMTDVKTGLAAAKTDAPIQANEQQILSDLQAMIDNLIVDPKERQFEQQAGGGGSGGGGGEKPLPAEAELRMMKALQGGVNVSTVDVSKSLNGNKPDEKANNVLVNLGRRQGEMRKLLDELLSKASGESALGPEIKDAKPLPEEATIAQIDEQELQAELLGGKPGAKDKEIDVRRVGDRMSRSRVRLEGERDPGKVTQVIQKRILDDFDLLIEAARQQQGNCKGGGKPSPQDVAQVPKPNDKQAQNQGKNASAGGSKSAANSNRAGANTGQANAGKNIEEKSEEWGRISPRLRGPVLETKDETIVERYRRLVEDYTQAVSTEATGGKTDGATP